MSETKKEGDMESIKEEKLQVKGETEQSLVVSEEKGLNKELDNQAEDEHAVKKKPKFKPVGFKAPSATTCTASDGKVKLPKVENPKKKNVKIQEKAGAEPASDKKVKPKKTPSTKIQQKNSAEDNLLTINEFQETKVKADVEKKKKPKKPAAESKPARHLTDDEYERLFEAALERVVGQTDTESVVVQSETPAHIQLLISTSSKEPHEVKTEDIHVAEDNFESLIHHAESLEDICSGSGDAKEVVVPVNEDSADEDAQPEGRQSGRESAELIQLQNEITPAVSDNEASNMTKPIKVPTKQKKIAPPKKLLHPKQLQLGVEKKAEKVLKKIKEEVAKPKIPKKKKKMSKKNEMLNREIEETGTWVQCVSLQCLKWRHLKDTHDPSVLPERWTCDMNPDGMYNSCDLPEEDFEESVHQETFIYTHFAEGSVVWAKMVGYPWWPAMIEIDPDVGEFFDVTPSDPMLPTHYHVVFFDQKVSRAWIRTTHIRNFTGADFDLTSGSCVLKGHSYKKEVDAAKVNAQEALKHPLKGRLKMFSFSARFRGSWSSFVKEEKEDTKEKTFWEDMKTLAKGRKRKRRRVVERDEDESLQEKPEVDVELHLDEMAVDEILDNAESILNAADDLCSLEESLDHCDEDPDFVSSETKSKFPPKSLSQEKCGEDPKEKKSKEKKIKKKKSKHLKSTEENICKPENILTGDEQGSTEMTQNATSIKQETESRKQSAEKTKEDDSGANDETESVKAKVPKSRKLKKFNKTKEGKEEKQKEDEITVKQETEEPVLKQVSTTKSRTLKKRKVGKVCSEDKNPEGADTSKETEEKVIKQENISVMKKKNVKFGVTPAKPDKQSTSEDDTDVQNEEKVDRSIANSEAEPSQSLLGVKPKTTDSRYAKRKTEETNSGASKRVKKKMQLHAQKNHKTLNVEKCNTDTVKRSHDTNETQFISNVKVEKPINNTVNTKQMSESASESEEEMDLSKTLLEIQDKASAAPKQDSQSQLTEEMDSQTGVAVTPSLPAENRDNSDSDPFDCEDQLDFSTNIQPETVAISKSLDNSDPFEALEE